MRKSIGYTLFSTLVATLLIASGGCKKDGDEASRKASSGEIEVPTKREFFLPEVPPQSLDPNKVAEAAGKKIAAQMFEPLVIREPGTDKIVPGGATSWETSADGKTYTFHLRKDAQWSDGKPITAADYLYSWRRALLPETKSRNAQQYWVIRGAKDFNLGKTQDFSSVGVSAPDPYTLKLELNGPAPYILDLLVYVVFAPTPQHAIEKHGARWIRPENIVSNGAFKMVEYKLRDKVVMERNPKYWDAKNVWLDRVVFYLVEQEPTVMQWYDQGKVHWTPGFVSLAKVPELLKSGRQDMKIYPFMCTYYYSINTEKPPFDNEKVRRAFNMAIDKGQLVRQVLGQGQKAANHLVPEMFAKTRGFKGVTGDRFDPARARKLLAEAGYPGGKGLPPITVIYNTMEGHRVIAAFTQRSLKENLGVEIQINNMEWKTLLETIKSGDYQLGRSSWCADFPDPENFLAVFHSRGENNYSRWKNPEFDSLLDQLSSAADQATRNKLTIRLETLLNKGTPILPFYFYTRSYLLKEFVQGLAPSTTDDHFLKYVWFGQPGSTNPGAPAR